MWVIGGLVCGGSILLMTLVLIAFIMGECQKMARTRMVKKDTDERAELARKQMEKRSRRLAKERVARQALEDGETMHYEQVRELFQNDGAE